MTDIGRVAGVEYIYKPVVYLKQEGKTGPMQIVVEEEYPTEEQAMKASSQYIRENKIKPADVWGRNSLREPKDKTQYADAIAERKLKEALPQTEAEFDEYQADGRLDSYLDKVYADDDEPLGWREDLWGKWSERDGETVDAIHNTETIVDNGE